jgi:hypothetical protein
MLEDGGGGDWSPYPGGHPKLCELKKLSHIKNVVKSLKKNKPN